MAHIATVSSPPQNPYILPGLEVRPVAPPAAILRFQGVVHKIIALSKVKVSLVTPEVFANSPQKFIHEFDKVTCNIISTGVNAKTVKTQMLELLSTFISNPPPVNLIITRGGHFEKEDFTPPKYEFLLAKSQSDENTSSTSLEKVCKSTVLIETITLAKVQKLFVFLSDINFFSWSSSDKMCALKMNLTRDFAQASGFSSSEMAFAFYKPKEGLPIKGYKAHEVYFHCALTIRTAKDLLVVDPFISDRVLELRDWTSIVTKEDPIEPIFAKGHEDKIQLDTGTSYIILFPPVVSIYYDPDDGIVSPELFRLGDRYLEQCQLSASRHTTYFEKHRFSDLSASSQDFLTLD